MSAADQVTPSVTRGGKGKLIRNIGLLAVFIPVALDTVAMAMTGTPIISAFTAAAGKPLAYGAGVVEQAYDRVIG